MDRGRVITKNTQRFLLISDTKTTRPSSPKETSEPQQMSQNVVQEVSREGMAKSKKKVM